MIAARSPAKFPHSVVRVIPAYQGRAASLWGMSDGA
ncbi:hypothetical protein LCGC14_0992180 [marine sediment metagenome]|uniref:Uncharacterized protein n=1 Tax=marine sediment metagenome TaxID=412755 RepID=A0A0F9RC67_9ZZZZ